MEMKYEKIDEIDVVTPEGRIDTSTAKAFEEGLIGVVAKSKKIIVQFNKLDYISSAGLRVVLMAQKKMGPQGGTLVLTGMSANIANVFKMSGFDKILKICPTIDESKQLFN